MIDLVMGYARGYDEATIRPFCKTLRDSGYKGRVVMMADKGAAREAAKWNIDVRPCPKPGPGMLPHSARFAEMALLAQSLNWTGLFLADTRDIIFQKDIMCSLPSQGLNAFEEDDGMSIGTCPYNSLWIELAYGKDMLDKMRYFPISCVGTTCGSRLSMIKYLELLANEVKSLQPKTRKPQDQAAHNHLCRNVLKPTIHSNEGAEIYTVGYIQRGTVRVVDGKIVNAAGDVPAVIHQWDRHQNLKAHVEGLL